MQDGSRAVPSSPIDACLIRVDRLEVERGGRIVLSNLSFSLAAGETLLVSGRNGAGKSTLLRTLAGLLRPAQGEVRYALADDERRGPESVHYLGYEDALKPSLTVRENLAFWLEMLAAPGDVPESSLDEASVESALAAYGIARLVDLPAAYLSAGQKRRVALARLLLAPRPVWLLDEPLIALDVGAQERVVEMMKAHAAGGGAILLASHQPIATITRQIDLDSGMAA